jgi:DNA-binding XRE family transcriptional regulator
MHWIIRPCWPTAAQTGMTAEMKMNQAHWILNEEVGLARADLAEASVRRPPRSSVYVATFTAAHGGQITRSTGQRDYDAAMEVAREWEAAARREREAAKAAGQGSVSRRRLACGLSQAQVAALMDLSERAVRAIEQRAIEKLKRHPLLKGIWKEYTESRLSLTDEPAAGTLTSGEAAALLGLAQTALERQVIQKILALVRQIP